MSLSLARRSQLSRHSSIVAKLAANANDIEWPQQLNVMASYGREYVPGPRTRTRPGPGPVVPVPGPVPDPSPYLDPYRPRTVPVPYLDPYRAVPITWTRTRPRPRPVPSPYRPRAVPVPVPVPDLVNMLAMRRSPYAMPLTPRPCVAHSSPCLATAAVIHRFAFGPFAARPGSPATFRGQ